MGQIKGKLRMADTRHLICLDLETGGVDTSTCEILEIGAVAIDPYNLTIKEEFSSLIQPEDFDAIDPKALEITGLKIEDLKKAPPPKIVLKSFVDWIHKFNPAKNNSNFKAPVACGWNIHNFDLPILDRYFQKFGYWDKKKNWRAPLNPIFAFDAMNFIWLLFRNNQDIESLRLTNVLEYMGLDKEEIENSAHGALWDVQKTTQIVLKLLRLGIFLTEFKENGKRRLEIKGCMNNELS